MPAVAGRTRTPGREQAKVRLLPGKIGTAAGECTRASGSPFQPGFPFKNPSSIYTTEPGSGAKNPRIVPHFVQPDRCNRGAGAGPAPLRSHFHAFGAVRRDALGA